MAPKHTITRSSTPPGYRPTGTERREARTAALATEQADLKREAAERRSKRAEAMSKRDDASGSAPDAGDAR